MVPVIALAGFGLFDRALPLVGPCVEIGIPMLILFIAFSQYLKPFQAKHLTILERFALVISITVIWAYAHLLTASGACKHRPEKTQLINCRTDKANLISAAPWIKIPYPLQWGAPTFDAGHAFGMMAAVLVSLAKAGAGSATLSMGYAAAKFADAFLRGLRGDAGVVECSFVTSQVIELPFFATKVRLGRTGAEEIFPLGLLNEYERAGLEKAKKELGGSIQKGVSFIKS